MMYTFDDFVLDSAARNLSRHRVPVKLQPKVMDLLIILIENHDRFVSKAELHERLWGGVHVGSASLVRLVSELRRALNDDGKGQQYVRTLHGRGYHFCAPVSARATVSPTLLSHLGHELTSRSSQSLTSL